MVPGTCGREDSIFDSLKLRSTSPCSAIPCRAEAVTTLRVLDEAVLSLEVGSSAPSLYSQLRARLLASGAARSLAGCRCPLPGRWPALWDCLVLLLGELSRSELPRLLIVGDLDGGFHAGTRWASLRSTAHLPHHSCVGGSSLPGDPSAASAFCRVLCKKAFAWFLCPAWLLSCLETRPVLFSLKIEPLSCAIMLMAHFVVYVHFSVLSRRRRHLGLGPAARCSPGWSLPPFPPLVPEPPPDSQWNSASILPRGFPC